MTVEATCIDCGATLKGTIIDKPKEGEGSILNVYISNEDSSKKHFSKRRLSGLKRRTMAAQMVLEMRSASYMRRMAAGEQMEFGDLEPSTIPNLETLRKAKQEAMQSGRLHPDPIIALFMLQDSEPLKQSVHEVGRDFVHFWSPEQISVYNSLVHKGHKKVAIDASGKFVNKIQRTDGSMSGHIFLYVMAVNVPDNARGQVPVCQMLSGRHNTNGILYWFKEFLRLGASVPNEVVTDDSRALTSAACQAFALVPDTQTYIDLCFAALTTENTSSPACYIRIDVAHLLKYIGQWKELQQRTTHRLVRQFYMRCIGLLVNCENMESAKEIISSILLVASSEMEGELVSGVRTPSDLAKFWLKSLMHGQLNEELDSLIRCEESLELIDDPDDMEDIPARNMKEWVDKILLESKHKAQESALGNRENMMNLPAIVSKLTKLFYRLPLWTSIMNHTFQITGRPSSAGVEGLFNDLKSRQLRLPSRIDDFVVDYLDCVKGILNICEAQNRRELELNRPSASQELNIQDHPSNSEECDVQENTSTAGEPNIQCPTSVSEESRTQGHSSDFEGLNMQENPCGSEEPNDQSNLNGKEDDCPLCKYGVPETGAHRCKNCNRVVYLLPSCSQEIEGEEEGYGQKRLCKNCAKVSLKSVSSLIPDRHVESVRESNEIGNWKNLALGPRPKKAKNARYLNPCPQWETISENIQKTEKIGLMKNGQKVINAKSAKTLSNTCAFDAVVHALTAAYTDSRDFRQYVDTTASSLFNLVKHLAQGSVGKVGYSMRLGILAEIYPETMLTGILISVRILESSECFSCSPVCFIIMCFLCV